MNRRRFARYSVPKAVSVQVNNLEAALQNWSIGGACLLVQTPHQLKSIVEVRRQGLKVACEVLDCQFNGETWRESGFHYRLRCRFTLEEVIDPQAEGLAARIERMMGADLSA